MTEHDRQDPTQATRDWIDVKFASFRSEMRMLFVVSVAGNQLLTHLSLAPLVGAVSQAALIVAAIAIKAALFR